MLTITIRPIDSVIVQESDEFVRDQPPTRAMYSAHLLGQPTLSMSVRGCPNGKSIPAIQGPGASSIRLNPSNDAKRPRRVTVRRAESKVP